MNNKEGIGCFLQRTDDHKIKISKVCSDFIGFLSKQVHAHDDSKYDEPEVSMFGEYESEFENVEYGTDAYFDLLKKLDPAIQHHYKQNRHHPEHFSNGISGMNLFDLIEMYLDWLASSSFVKEDFLKSIDHNRQRFNLSDDLYNIFKNTANILLPDGVELKPVESSNVSRVGFSQDLNELYVEFKNGKTYKYFDVVYDEYNKLLSADSVGRYLNEKIKPSKNYKKMY